MSNFVDDLTSLPAGKVDGPGSAISVPTGQKVTAAEWNSVMQALVDVRGAILTGKVHGLEDNPVAGVGSATQAILRSRNGALEVSEGGATFNGVATVFNVKAYGAKGDGATDDAAAIQSAITAAEVSGGTVYLPPGIYKVNAEITTNSSSKLAIRGEGTTATVIRAGAAVTSVLGIVGSVDVSDLTLNANLLATYAGRGAGSCSGSVFRSVLFTGAVKDGWRFAAAGISDGNSFHECVWEGNGTIFRTSGRGAVGGSAIETVTPGTVATNGLTVTGMGTSFASMGIRRGDFIAVGVSPLTEYLQIKLVTDDTHIVLEDTSPAANVRSGQAFSIGVGNGYAENYGAADNNINHLTNGRARSNAGCGLVFGGLYGPRAVGVQIDGHHNGYAIAVADGMISPCYGAYFDSIYIEDCAAGGWYLGYAAGVTIAGTMDSGLGAPSYNGQVTAAAPPRWRAPDSSRTFGTWIASSRYSYAAGSDLDPIGGGYSNIPVTQTPLSTRFSVNGPLRISAQSVTVAAGTPIVPSSGFAYLYVTGAVTMTATPTITQTGYTYGDLLHMSVASGAAALTLQDESVLSGSKLHLGKAKLVLATDQTAVFWYSPNGYWSLLSTTGTLSETADSTGSAGNATQNTLSGRVAIDAGTSSVVVTNSNITTASKVFAQLQTVDGTLTFIKSVVPASGSFTINGNANAAGNTNVAWQLVT